MAPPLVFMIHGKWANTEANRSRIPLLPPVEINVHCQKCDQYVYLFVAASTTEAVPAELDSMSLKATDSPGTTPGAAAPKRPMAPDFPRDGPVGWTSPKPPNQAYPLIFRRLWWLRCDPMVPNPANRTRRCSFINQPHLRSSPVLRRRSFNPYAYGGAGRDPTMRLERLPGAGLLCSACRMLAIRISDA